MEGNRLNIGVNLANSELIRRFLYPPYQRRLTPLAYRHLKELRSYEFASREQVERVQWRKLQSIVCYAAKHVPYYRSLFREQGIVPEDISTPMDFARLPILTKAIVQTRLKELIAECRDSKDGLPNASGGSTGKPVHFYQDQAYWEFAQACEWFVEGWWGIRPGDRTASVWGCDRDLSQQSWREQLYGIIVQTRMCNAFALSEAQLDKFARMLMSWQPRFITGYASALGMFARFLLDRPKIRIRPVAIKSSAETLTRADREAVEKALAAPLYDFYGSREVNNLAAECPWHKGLHVNTMGRYVEIVADAGQPLPPGVPGQIVVTDLTNWFMPLLRYQMNDVSEWMAELCPCGRQFPRLARIFGRSSDFITAADGRAIHGEYFTHIFYGIPNVKSFQVVQERVGAIRIDVLVGDSNPDAVLEEVRRRLGKAIGPELVYELRRVEKIERPASGKFRFTVSDVPVRWGKEERERSDAFIGAQ